MTTDYKTRRPCRCIDAVNLNRPGRYVSVAMSMPGDDCRLHLLKLLDNEATPYCTTWAEKAGACYSGHYFETIEAAVASFNERAHQAGVDLMPDYPKTPGQEAFERDVQKRPTYQDGTPRRRWTQLSDVERWTWERGGTL